jgi:hypothetical protein
MNDKVYAVRERTENVGMSKVHPYLIKVSN